MPDLETIVETFDFLSAWDDRYLFLEELGGELGYLAPELKNNDNIVHGCASNVWVIGHPGENGDAAFHFEAEAEQPIIRGLVYLMLQIFANKTPDEILDTNTDITLQRLGLDEHLSTQRHIGMYALVQKMKNIALPYASQNSFET
jgi:cysteine desulfuration protein SufE